MCLKECLPYASCMYLSAVGCVARQMLSKMDKVPYTSCGGAMHQRFAIVQITLSACVIGVKGGLMAWASNWMAFSRR